MQGKLFIGIKNLIDHPDLFHVQGYQTEAGRLPLRATIFGEVRKNVFTGPWVSFESHAGSWEELIEALPPGFDFEHQRADLSLTSAGL